MFRKTLLYIVKRQNHQWIKPSGYDTGIEIFNCIQKDQVPFIVKNKNMVTWYSCGPTVYDTSHIGHASTFVKLDIIQRLLRDYFKLNLITVMNITDVDDKIIDKAIELNCDVSEVARKYEKEFWKDLSSLNCKEPDKVLRVTENIDVIIDFIQKLIENNIAYRANDGSVYFSVTKYPGYGKLQNIGEDVGNLDGIGMKRNRADFALWKSPKKGDISWSSPFGNGRPGWHIECSALAGSTLGSSIDVHAGGIDLRFPHHENEEAQSCCYFKQRQWVNYWIHTGQLHRKDETKMSKSLRNTVPIQDMLNVCDANTFRMACLMSHYRHNMEYSEDMLGTAHNYLLNYQNFLHECKQHINGIIRANLNADLVIRELNYTANFVDAALRNDFNTSECIKALNSLISRVNKMLHSASDSGMETSSVLSAVHNFIAGILENFGFDLNNYDHMQQQDLSLVMDVLLNFRKSMRELGIVRNDKDILSSTDNVRHELRKNGIVITDRGKISTWSRQ